ncbi:MAG TPA: hypothetical protein VK972_08935 [Wenzhouxiangella sp.]|nr:hypothetical protein [Wenzhouxiangella sp.]
MALDGAGIRSFEIESKPAGAEVITITGNHGATPLTLTERDIYPNSYRPERQSQYGVITLRKAGCQDMNIRPGESDIVNGLSLVLDCGAGASAGDTAPALPAGRPAGANDDEPASKKLAQLRFLQDLLDEGLITADEEATIRKRILQQP